MYNDLVSMTTGSDAERSEAKDGHEVSRILCSVYRDTEYVYYHISC